MGKSNKKTKVQVAPVVSAVSEKSGTKGKRDAEKELDKSVVTKKQKTETEVKASTKESSSSEDSSSDDEPVKTSSTPIKNGAISSKNGSVGALSKKGEENSSSEGDSDEDKEDASEGVKQTAPDTKLEKKEESSPSESDTDEGDASAGSSSSEESSEKSSDVESEDEKPLKISKKPRTPLVQNQTSESRTIFVGNLSYDVGPDDLSEFFKAAGEVVAVRLATRLDGNSKGFCHIDFATEEAIKKALELNGQEFFGRALRLEVAQERDSHTPQSGNGKDSKGQSYTIFVKGFDKSLAQDQIRNSLQEHFGSCGRITRVSIPKDYESGALKGIAYMDFKDQDAYNKAFELNGSELGDYTLTVDEAKPKGDDSYRGRNSSRDGGGRGGGKFGRSGGGRGGRGDGGRGRRGFSSGRDRGRSSRGKKTTFGDD